MALSRMLLFLATYFAAGGVIVDRGSRLCSRLLLITTL